MTKFIIRNLHAIAQPLIKRLHFIIVFLLLMGLVDTLRGIAGAIYEGGAGILHNPSAMRSITADAGHVSIWFLAAYILAAITIKWNHWLLKLVIIIIPFTFGALQFFLVDNFHWPISPTYLMLAAETNSKETGEFLNTYIFSSYILKTILWCIAFIAIYFILRYLWIKILHRASLLALGTKSAIKTTIGIILIPTLLFGMSSSQVYLRMAQCNSMEGLRRMSKPKDPFTCTYSSLLMLNLMDKSMTNAKEITLKSMKASLSDNADDSLNVVLVIGESYIKYHASIYGYNLNTTPHMKQEKEKGSLFVFNNVVTPNNLTSNAMKNMLSTNNSSNGEDWYDKPFFPAIFRGAGYDVFFWDNQKAFNSNSEYTFALNSFLYCKEFEEKVYSEVNNNLPFQFDGDLIKSFADSVRLKSSHNLIIFHLMGQHFIAKNRFPQNEDFIHFTADSVKSAQSFLNTEKKQKIADYDNATLYNDHVLNKIFQMFDSSNSIVIYLSDHGEEIYDFRNRMGRDHGEMSEMKAKYEYEIPFVIWCSDIFKEKHPDTVKALESSLDKPFMIDNLCNMLFHIAGVKTPFYNPKDNLLSPKYKCKSRLLEGYWDYDKEMHKALPAQKDQKAIESSKQPNM